MLNNVVGLRDVISWPSEILRSHANVLVQLFFIAFEL